MELTDFEVDVLSEFVLARHAAGLTDGGIRTDTTHLEQIRDWFGHPLWEMEPRDDPLHWASSTVTGCYESYSIPHDRGLSGSSGFDAPTRGQADQKTAESEAGRASATLAPQRVQASGPSTSLSASALALRSMSLGATVLLVQRACAT
jgi:hypothetical protein